MATETMFQTPRNVLPPEATIASVSTGPVGVAKVGLEDFLDVGFDVGT